MDVWIFYAIFVMLSDKMLVQYKVYSHIVELDQDIYGSDTPDDTAVARLQSCKLL